MRRQWFLVLGILAALGAGGWALVYFAGQTAIAVGQPAPEFTAKNLTTGKRVSFDSTYRGGVTLVNIWATWCDPCKEEIPAMDSVYQALGPRGFRIAAVSIDRGGEAVVKQFAKDYGITFDVLHDPSGDIEKIFQTTGVPESFLINREGRIVRIMLRGYTWNSPGSRRIIEELLAAPAS
jgi:cytochrome c biogenesis protein CcmG, thiol:disulfide interchange protein DsbE